MSSLKYWYKVTRPQQCLIAALSTWLIALLSNGPFWITSVKVAAPMTIFFSVLGASLWHYGARHDMYARKHWDPVIVKKPYQMLDYGTSAFAVSIVIAIAFLPWICTVIAVTNFMVIIFYAKRLDRYWPWKNLVIAFICTTPLLIGWLSGHHLHPIVPPMIMAAFFLYLAREVLKDIQDRIANRGLRFTMVMGIGVKLTLRITGALLIIALLIMSNVWEYIPNNSIIAVVSFWSCCLLLLWNAVTLLRGINIASKYQRIDYSVLAFLICILTTKLYLS